MEGLNTTPERCIPDKINFSHLVKRTKNYPGHSNILIVPFEKGYNIPDY